MNKTELGRPAIAEGMVVEINPQSDRSRKILVSGTVSEILTQNENHPHGVLVRLESGEVGRVKKVLSHAEDDQCQQRSAPADTNDALGLIELINYGENHRVEFKSDILWSAKFSGEDIKNHRPQSKELHEYGKAASKVIIAKSIAGFLNSDGGTLIVGVRENKDTETDEIIGVQLEFNKLQDGTQDGYRRMIVDLVKDHFPSNIFNHLNDYIEIVFQDIGTAKLCGIKIKRSDKRVFLKLNKSDHFFIRTDASTRELSGEEIVDYCQNRFA